MNKIFTFLLFLCTFVVLAQTPHTDPHWIVNTKFSDEFDGNKNAIWQEYKLTDFLGSALGDPANIQYGTENQRTYIRFIAEMKNGTPYSAGVRVGLNYGNQLSSHPGLGYGYYEIEGRLLQTPNIQSGLWPAFWLQHGNNVQKPYWYEELDIFEPDNCQVRENNHHVSFHYYPDPDTAKFFSDTYSKYNVDMSQWHKYAVEWLPERVTFYLDDVAFFVISDRPTPYRQNTNLFIDLQTDDSAKCPPDILDGLLGCFDVNYFRYYQLKYDCNTVVTQIPNFNTYNYAVKKSISLSSTTTIPANSNITLRATDFIELQPGFSIDTGRELYLDVNPCDNTARVKKQD